MSRPVYRVASPSGSPAPNEASPVPWAERRGSGRDGPIVVKFGGAALEHPKGAVEYLRHARTGEREVVAVVSARQGVTDELEALVRARPSEERIHECLRGLVERHPSEGLTACLASLGRALRSLRDPDLPLDVAQSDVLSHGERLAARWFAGRLREGGTAAVALDADDLGLWVREERTGTVIDMDRSRRSLRPGLREILDRGAIPVVTGFFGRTVSGSVRTLGRGGSDATAVAIGAAIGASRVELVKEHHPVLSADPSRDPRAKMLPFLSYKEARAIAVAGARVLHPDVGPLAGAYGVVVEVVSLAEPTRRTRIGPLHSSARTRLPSRAERAGGAGATPG